MQIVQPSKFHVATENLREKNVFKVKILNYTKLWP